MADDFVLEYDMLQLIDGDDSFSIDLMGGSTSEAAYADVGPFLTNCSVDVSIAAPPTLAPPSLSKSRETVATLPDNFSELLLDNEVAQRYELEKAVHIDSNLKKPDKQTGREQKNGALNVDAFTNLAILSSPCPSVPSSCPSTKDGSPWNTEAGDEYDVGPPLLAAARSTTKVEKQVQTYQVSTVEQRMVSMTPPESSLSPGQTDRSVSASPLSGLSDVTVEKIGDDDDEMEKEMMDDEIDLLGKEAKYLDAQVDFLVSRAKSSRPRRQSIKQHRFRDAQHLKLLAKSQQDNQLLNNLVMQQKIYQDNFQAMLAVAPVNDVRMALMTPIESFIRLGKDFNERRKTILSLREEKLDVTYKFIEQKAKGLDFNQPYQYSDTFEKFGKHYCVNFAISKFDDVSVFQVGRAIYEMIAGKDEAAICAIGSTMIYESLDTIKCNFMHQRIISSMKWDDEDAAQMPDMESNAIFYCRFSDNSAVLATDYIDQDDLHPYDTSNRIRKDVASGVVLSGHTDADGKKFVVMKRFLMAKYHMYSHKVSQEQQDRFFASMPRCTDSMKALITDHIQRDQAVASRVCDN
ncbi:hypothetical protein PsorP6_007171 [Peronosclerospora sorghi]|uniref:Uncharacterized protein n=1 Tax=Peronosclerospora sorghi TaxID=230839 RepID=A0ACC0W9R9_9STRA|nr:hypothetical protein PsorP6_007171 [Peronosclerospora sorghi]